MTRRYYAAKATEKTHCGRCGALLGRHFTGHQLGCPDGLPDEPHPCEYTGCHNTVIADVRLWLCEDHTPDKTGAFGWTRENR